MAKVKASASRRPALTPEARENQLISMAYDAAERQFQEGTASSQVITHFLKLGTVKAELENKLLRAKTESLQSTQRIEELYSEAIKAMQRYSGRGGEEDDDEY